MVFFMFFLVLLFEKCNFVAGNNIEKCSFLLLISFEKCRFDAIQKNYIIS